MPTSISWPSQQPRSLSRQQALPKLRELSHRRVFAGSIHIASPQQCLVKDLPLGRRLTLCAQVELRYNGSYGEYYANVPGESLLLVQDETSIECISKFLWQVIAVKSRQDYKSRRI